jgi:SAM-dependent methyltransferase
MRFSHKLAKIFQPRGLRSAKQHLGRIFLTRRLVFRFDVEQIVASIDREKFAEIRNRHAVDNPGPTWPKYLDLKKWMEINLRRVRDLELDYGRRREILDIGSGAGYFLYICKWLGHRPLGLDIDEVPMYPEMTRMLGLERVVWRVEAFVPLPDLGRKFDLITAFMICFNNHNRPGLWGVAEWDFFLDDITRHLKPGGRVWLELNRQKDGSFMTRELSEFFQSRGAKIERHQIMFPGAPLPSRGELVAR